jgi:hypothetical protein
MRHTNRVLKKLDKRFGIEALTMSQPECERQEQSDEKSIKYDALRFWVRFIDVFPHDTRE